MKIGTINPSVASQFAISSEEYALLEKEFVKLCYHIAHQLQKKNTKNNYTEDFDDIVQELKFALVTAAAYRKRQVWIEKSFKMALAYVKDPVLKLVLSTLSELWQNRKRHGANKQKFGTKQENILSAIVNAYVPKEYIPNKTDKIKLNSKFSGYCKSVIWNKEKNIGKKITREKSLRSGLVSISEFDYLAKG
jgi:hypothetical protein